MRQLNVMHITQMEKPHPNDEACIAVKPIRSGESCFPLIMNVTTCIFFRKTQ